MTQHIAKPSHRSSIAAAILTAFCSLTLQACVVAAPEDDWDNEVIADQAAVDIADESIATEATLSDFTYREPVLERQRRALPERVYNVADDIDRAENTTACQLDQRVCGTICCESYERCNRFSDPTGKHIFHYVCTMRELADSP